MPAHLILIHFISRTIPGEQHKLWSAILGSFILVKPKEKCLCIIIVIVIVTLVINSMQCIYKYIHETNHISRARNVAAVLYLQFVLHVMLLPMLNMFCTFTLALPTVSVQCTIWLFSAVR